MGAVNRPTILPPNASALMRAVDQAAPQWDTLPNALRGPVYGHPQPLAPWLAGEWGIGQFARYFNGDTGQLIAAGVPWLMQRGTAAGVRRALGWLGFTGVVIQEDGARLHIDPGQNVTAEQVRAIAHVVRATVPAHVHFYRIFHGLNVRPFIYGRSRWGHAVYMNESGEPIDVDPWGGPISVSQITVYRRLGQPLAMRAQVMRHERIAHPVRRALHWRWGHAVYGQNRSYMLAAGLRTDHIATQSPRMAPSTEPAPFEMRDHYTHASGAPLNHRAQGLITAVVATQAPAFNQPNTWRGRWDGRPWRKSIPYQMTLEQTP